MPVKIDVQYHTPSLHEWVSDQLSTNFCRKLEGDTDQYFVFYPKSHRHWFWGFRGVKPSFKMKGTYLWAIQDKGTLKLLEYLVSKYAERYPDTGLQQVIIKTLFERPSPVDEALENLKEAVKE